MANLAAEGWSWYSLTWLVVITRMVSQVLLRGSVSKFKVDDYLMMVIMLTDTFLLVAMTIISHTDTNLIDPSNAPWLLPEEVKQRQLGSKMVVLAEQMQLITIWLTKACLLIMYHRLTMSLKSHMVVKLVAGYVAFGFVLMEILYLGVWCRPFSQYWAVPPNSTQCSAATNHLITNAVFNISSDVMIILIPMPIFLQTQLALKKKCILMGVFALGGFTILCSILNKFYSFTEPFGSEWTFWYIRESSTAIIVANLPLTWTVFRRLFHLRSFISSGSSRTRSGKPGSTMRSHGQSQSRDVNRSHVPRGHTSNGDNGDNVDDDAISLKIYQRHDVQVSSEPAPTPGRRGFAEPSLADGSTTTIRGGPNRSFLFDPDDEGADTLTGDPFPLVKPTSHV